MCRIFNIIMAAVASTTASAPVLAGAMARESSYPMVPMVDAMRILLTECGRAAAAHPIVRVPLAQAVDMVLAENIIATEPFPPFRASVMDGYAVHSSDGAGVFPVVADLTAGSPDTFKLAKGSVAYITTGAPVPEGADAVLLVERTEAVAGEPGKVRLLEAVPAGEAVRPIGYDIPKGTTVLGIGERLGAAEIGLLASLGILTVPVYRRVAVTILSTGNELVDAKNVPGSGQIRDSNRPMLLAAIQKAGALPLDHGIAPDTPEALKAAIGNCLADGDVCVMSGGVSMGSLDLIKPVLTSMGTVHFGRLLMKPGKPATFATIQWPQNCAPELQTTKLVFALPGNPVSALVCFGLLVEPAIK
jgi:gephyrin